MRDYPATSFEDPTGSLKEAIMLAAREAAMACGYSGINFRDLAETVGITAASINYYFGNKALLGEAVVRRYWEDISRDLEAISANADTPMDAQRQYPGVFRASLARDNRICLSSFMAAESDELPAPVLKEVQAFADVNVAWLSKELVAAKVVGADGSEERARAIYAAVAGAQIVATSRSNIALFDTLIEAIGQPDFCKASRRLRADQPLPPVDALGGVVHARSVRCTPRIYFGNDSC